MNAIDEINALSNRLPENYRGVFRMAMEGHTNVEIADAHELHVENVNSLLQRARKRLSRILEELES